MWNIPWCSLSNMRFTQLNILWKRYVSFLLHATCHHCSNFASLCFTTLPISATIHRTMCAFFSLSLSVEYGGCGRNRKKRNWWNHHVHCISLWTPVATICIGVQWRKLLKNNHWIFIWIQVCHCQLFHHVSYNEFSLYQKQYDSFQFHLGFFFLLRITTIVCQKNIWDRRYFLVLNLQSNTLFC